MATTAAIITFMSSEHTPTHVKSAPKGCKRNKKKKRRSKEELGKSNHILLGGL